MKEYAAALGSNPEKAQKIFSTIPDGKTRSIPGGTLLGEGAEGFVAPAVTGGKGESAVKVFTPEKAKAEGTNLIGVSVPYRERGRIMASDPSVFPEIRGYGDRHIIAERLQPAQPGPLGMLHDYATRAGYRRLVKNYITASRRSDLSPDERARRVAALREAFPLRNTPGKYGEDWAKIYKYTQEFRDKSGGKMVLGDVSPGHNVMLSSRGKLVISDPLIMTSTVGADRDIPHIQLRKGKPALAPRKPGIPFVRRSPAPTPPPPRTAARYAARGLPRYTAAGIAGLLGALAVPSRAPQGVDAR